MRQRAIAFEPFSARIEAFEALRGAIDPRKANAVLLRGAADGLDAAAPLYEHSVTATAYTALAELLRICAQLVEWRTVVLDAGPEAERFVRAAKERYGIWTTEFEGKLATDALLTASSAVSGIASVQEVGQILDAISMVPIPIGVFREERHMRLPVLGTKDGSQMEVQEADKLPPELAVAFLKFSIDGKPAAGTHYLTPGETHDLEIEVRVSRWPEEAETLELRPLSIDPPESHAFPVFRLGKPTGTAPFVMTGSGRAIVKFAQGLNARPSEFRYAAHFEPLLSEQPMAVVGQRTLRIEAFNLKRMHWTGFPNLDAKLVKVRDILRSETVVPPEDVTNALSVLRILSNFAGRCVRDNEINEKWLETRYQKAIRGELRRDPEIGSELDEHSQVAGGIMDLAYRGICIELKASSERRLNLDDCRRYAPQAAAYAVGLGKRLAVLSVLDSSPKTEGAIPVEDCIDIFLENISNLSVCIVVVLVQANLVRPSALSRG
jgi:hypothetical protein